MSHLHYFLPTKKSPSFESLTVREEESSGYNSGFLQSGGSGIGQVGQPQQLNEQEERATIEMEALPDPDELFVRVIDRSDDDDDSEEPSSTGYYYDQNKLFTCTFEFTKQKLYKALFFVTCLLIITIIAPNAAFAVQEQKSTSSKAVIGDSSDGNDTLAPNDKTDAPQIPTDWTFDDTKPFSTLDPTVKLYDFKRPEQSSPSSRLDPLRSNNFDRSLRGLQSSDNNNNKPLPTNMWYQNMLLLGETEEPGANHRVYAMPYVVDAAGTIPGLRVHSFQKVTTYNTVNLNINEPYALTLGAALDYRQSTQLFSAASKGYSVQAATPLGVTLEWEFFQMRSTIIKGMPYATMEYGSRVDHRENDLDIVPTLISEVQLQGAMTIDGVASNNCNGSGDFAVEKEAELLFTSGITWLVFFSRPTRLQCTKQGGRFLLQVVEDFNIKDSLIIRVAMVVPQSDQDTSDPDVFEDNYKKFLKTHAGAYPGPFSRVQQSVNDGYANLNLDWHVQQMYSEENELAMFGLPHHQDKLTAEKDLCTLSLVGPACPILGNTWSMIETLPQVDYRAPRSPDPVVLPRLIEALQNDIRYQIADNFQRGAGDTYFSGKQLAKLARILLIEEEIEELCNAPPNNDYETACTESSKNMPTQDQVASALNHLRASVEVWLNGNAQAPFVYDSAWGGVVSCGCSYSNGQCTNQVPNCPAFTDKLLNFGGGFYNDHHFHYGYHVYAASAIAHFDSDWGKRYFEDVLLLVRDYANPSPNDESFPVFRHKDWYQGHSWANGIGTTFLNGMNQESSSEAIASYEAVALFGKTMKSVFEQDGNGDLAQVANEIYKAGLVLTSTEIRSTKRYYQVTHDIPERKIYPDTYEANVVGIMWSTMTHYGTWFGNNPAWIYGIQLLPLTPISEERDDVDWGKEMFMPYSKSCDMVCAAGGWSVGVLAILATIGHQELALEQATQLSLAAFETPGGGGHSMSNTLWYLATRPSVKEPFVFTDSDLPPNMALDCNQPTTCTEDVLNSMADGYTCRERILWLMESMSMSQGGACAAVAVTEYPNECGKCNPNTSSSDSPGDPSQNQFCNNPTTCTDAVLDTLADGYSCRARIKWLMDTMKLSYTAACFQVAVTEFPQDCGMCTPN